MAHLMRVRLGVVMKPSKSTGRTLSLRKTHLCPLADIAIGVTAACGLALSGCMLESESDAPAEEALGEVEQAVKLNAFCTVNGEPSPVVNLCFGTTADITLRSIVRMELPPSTIPNPIVRWTYKSSGGALGEISGCTPFSNHCTVGIFPGCDPNAGVPPFRAGTTGKLVEISARIRSGDRFNFSSDTAAVTAFVPNTSQCAFGPYACVPPATPPILGIHSEYCGGVHSHFWTSVPNATNYQVQAMPKVSYDTWDDINDTYSYPGIIIDVGNNSCSGDSGGSFWSRVRACNPCGCSAWSSQVGFDPFYGECR
jgi:hypothetical protein